MNNCREKKVDLRKKVLFDSLAGVGSLRAKEDYSFHGQKALHPFSTFHANSQPAVRSNIRKRHA